MRSDGCSMAKKKSWFNLVKRFFVSDTHSKSETKEKRRIWMFGRQKIKRFASIAAPSSSKDRTLSEAEEEQSKCALTVAIATAAAAEAAVTAAHVAAEVVRLTRTPQSRHGFVREKEDEPVIENKICFPECSRRKILELAAIKIQTAFRGYLARKASRALKGIVKLQAIIRGRNVRRQAITTLKCLQSIVNLQSQVCAKRFGVAGTGGYDEIKQTQTLRDKITKMDSNSQRRWDDSILTKTEADVLFLSKKEAAIKRERIKEYSFSHRRSAESDQNKGNGRWRYWLEQWVDTQVVKSKELEDLDSVWTCDRKSREEYREKGPRLKSLRRQYQGLDSPLLVPRRSFHRKQCSVGEENSFSCSPVVPTYMAATESARAKARSMSSPKLRLGGFDTCSESYSPSKNKLPMISSITSEMSSYGRMGRPSAYQQRSPSLKGVPGPIKSSRATAKDLSFNSESSFRNWERQSALG